MTPTAVPRPTDAELAILRVIWKFGRATVREIHDRAIDLMNGHQLDRLRAIPDRTRHRRVVTAGCGQRHREDGDPQKQVMSCVFG